MTSNTRAAVASISNNDNCSRRFPRTSTKLPYTKEKTLEDDDPFFQRFKDCMVPEGFGLVPCSELTPSMELRNKLSSLTDASLIMNTRHYFTCKLRTQDFTPQWITDFSAVLLSGEDDGQEQPSSSCHYDKLRDARFLILLCMDETSFSHLSLPMLETLVSELGVISHIQALLEGPLNDDSTNLFPKVCSAFKEMDEDEASEQATKKLNFMKGIDKRLILQCQLFLGRANAYYEIQEDDGFVVLLHGEHCLENCKRCLKILEQHVVEKVKYSTTSCKYIEKVCVQTGEVVQVYRSWKHIQRCEGDSINLSQLSTHLNGRTLSYQGFAWRYAHAKKCRSRATNKISVPRRRTTKNQEPKEYGSSSPRRDCKKNAAAVATTTSPEAGRNEYKMEKICPKSGKVLEVFHSQISLLKSLGVEKFPNHLQFHLAGRNKELFRGFKWRGRNMVPSPRPVEQICPETGKVLHVFSCLQEVRDALPNTRRLHRILSAHKGHRCGDFVWRYADSAKERRRKTNPVQDSQQDRRDTESVGCSDGYKIEKICPESGRVVEVFYSQASLFESLHVDVFPQLLCDHLAGRQDLYRNFKWRSDNVIAPHGTVEQICPDTGKILRVFSNAYEVTRIYGPSGRLYEILNARIPNGTYRGFKWRYAAAKNSPGGCGHFFPKKFFT